MKKIQVTPNWQMMIFTGKKINIVFFMYTLGMLNFVLMKIC